MDAVVPNWGSDDVVALVPGIGDGTYDDPFMVEVGYNPRALATADLNGGCDRGSCHDHLWRQQGFERQVIQGGATFESWNFGMVFAIGP